MIELKNVSKKFEIRECEKIEILKNINLQIEDGEFVAITGKSGSGKSTLLHVMSGLMPCTEGQVLVEGKDISRLGEKELSMFRNQTLGFVFQSFYLEPSLTAIENVVLPLMVQNVNRETRIKRAKEALTMVGLAERVNHKPGQLSGGEQQRVSIARAIVTKPKIVFADEPTGNLDVENSKIVMDILEKMASEGTTIVMVTHDMEEAKRCRKIITISDGKLCGKGQVQ